MDKLVYWDFEYRNSQENILDLISCSLLIMPDNQKQTYWLFKDEESKTLLKNKILELSLQGYTFVAWAVTAESSAAYSLGIDPVKLKHIDNYIEYRCLTNHNHYWMYGKQLIDGKEKFTVPPKNKYQMDEDEREEANRSKPQHNLAAGCYKVLGVKIDTDFKDAVRNTIINGTDEEIIAAKDEILRYNESDIQYLPRLLKGIVNEYRRLLRDSPHELKTLRAEMLGRGDYAARTAIMERTGYPIDYERTLNFSKSVNGILWSLQHEINELFPKILPFTKKPNWDFSWSHVRTREWIETLPKEVKDRWLRTDTGKYSLKLDAFKEHFNFRHEFPEDNFGAQMVRYLSIKRNLNGFIQSKTAKQKNNFWDYVGSDRRVRPYFGIYGSQSARSQPKATGFLFLKSAWMRGLCSPPKGKAIAGIDYKSQEFLIAGLLSKDERMIQAYHSGDPYLYLAKLAKAVPWDGKREDYEEERSIFKVVTLSLQYGRGKTSLANELTNKLKKPYSENKADKLINVFNRAYRKHYKWKKSILRQYKREGYLKLPCGWYMWGDNDNSKSSNNFPVQGLGSTIMRRAVSLAQDQGVNVIFTLHDAIYIEFPKDDTSHLLILAECMKSAFRHSFPEDVKEHATVGLDLNAWSPEYEDTYWETPYGKCKVQKKYLDERSEVEYKKFSPYFEHEEFNL